MPNAKIGDKVRVHYTGKLESDEVFDSSKGRDPLEFTLGEKQVIPGFENGIVGMGVGENKTINIPKNEAYGDYRDDLIFEIDRANLPPDLGAQVGEPVEMRSPNGEIFRAIVKGIFEDKVSIDANSPLAGQNLIFDIELVEIINK